MEFQSLNLGRSEIGGFPEEGLVGFFFFLWKGHGLVAFFHSLYSASGYGLGWEVLGCSWILLRSHVSGAA